MDNDKLELVMFLTLFSLICSIVVMANNYVENNKKKEEMYKEVIQECKRDDENV